MIQSNRQQQSSYKGRIQDLLKGGSENLKKGIWSAALEAKGFVLLKLYTLSICLCKLLTKLV